MAQFFMDRGAKLVTNGTDNHLMLIDCVKSWNMAGKEVEQLFDRINITLNKNMIADDLRKPMDPSGVRLGTAAITTRGMQEKEMDILAQFMLRAIEKKNDEKALFSLRGEVKEFCLRFPVPGIQ
jgi:glycine hydroxymethyltransferase